MAEVVHAESNNVACPDVEIMMYSTALLLVLIAAKPLVWGRPKELQNQS